MMKLSKAQMEALKRLEKGPANRWSIAQNTMRALVVRGLAEPLGYATHGGYSSIRITNAGRNVLAVAFSNGQLTLGQEESDDNL